MQGRAPLPPTPLSRPREEGDGGCLDGKWEEAKEDGRSGGRRRAVSFTQRES